MSSPVTSATGAGGRTAVEVRMEGLTRRYGAVTALDGLDLTLRPGELIALLGPSGCGKTTTLRLLAGLEDADSGQITVGGRDITRLPASKRDMGMVFQAYSLFPHMTVLQNVAFGLRLRRVAKGDRDRRAMEILELVGLTEQAARYAHQISGGQQQRVALARALAIEPQVLLLDEPLSALDAKVRAQLRDQIRRIQLEVGITTLFVTHDQEEALAIADRVGVMRAGQLEQLAPPTEVYSRPADPVRGRVRRPHQPPPRGGQRRHGDGAGARSAAGGHQHTPGPGHRPDPARGSHPGLGELGRVRPTGRQRDRHHLPGRDQPGHREPRRHHDHGAVADLGRHGTERGQLRRVVDQARPRAGFRCGKQFRGCERGLSPGRPPLTTHRRLAPGPVLRRGASSPYRAVEVIAGERHVLRDDLGAVPPAATPPGPRPLLCLIHVTDLQLADVQSPTRFEFLNRYFADPRYAGLVPVQRPQEALTPHAVDATVRTVNGLRGPATGLPPALAVTTGDAIDNAQWNEVAAFLALFDGGLVVTDSGRPGYAGVQALDWPDDIFWKPDGIGRDGPDFFRRELGFPHHPGLLDAALREFTAGGLQMPWLSCFGNHEAPQPGRGHPDRGPGRRADRRPQADGTAGRVRQRPGPGALHGAPGGLPWLPRQVPADRGRRRITRREFVAAHFRPGARPLGHGFNDENSATEPPTTSMTHQPRGSSRWIPIAWPAGPTGAWTAAGRRLERPGPRRCSSAYGDRRGRRSRPGRTTGWSSCSPTTAWTP